MNNLDNDYHQWGPVLNVSQDCVRVPSLAVPVWRRSNLFVWSSLVVHSCNVICWKSPRLNISHSLWKICKGENAQWFLFHSTLVKWTLLLSEKSDKICWAWVKKTHTEVRRGQHSSCQESQGQRSCSGLRVKLPQSQRTGERYQRNEKVNAGCYCIGSLSIAAWCWL